MTYPSFENRNPHLDDAATIFDIVPGVELQVIRVDKPNDASEVVKILGDITIKENGAVFVDDCITTISSEGSTYSHRLLRSLSDIGVIPYQHNGTWNDRRASKVIEKSEI